MMVTGTCRHCGIRPISKTQKLCYRCWNTPGVRDLFLAIKWPGVGYDNTLNRPSPAEPTDTRPGSPEKLAVLIERAEHEELLHHEQDARFDDAV